MSYVRATPTEGETPADNRKMRKQELARGWRFACECTKCSGEAAEMGEERAQVSESAEDSEAKDKVEKVVEEGEATSA